MAVTRATRPPRAGAGGRPGVDKRAAYAALDETTIADAHRLRRRIGNARDAAALDALTPDIDAAHARLTRRLGRTPTIRYPEELPVSAARDEIAAAIATHQVVVVAGETGSGKTTQLPKILLELGYGRRGLIGHTQPRRLAARSVAERIAEETGTELGADIGYAVRFTDRVGENTLVKVMTDGILLRELTRDRLLRGYDAIIIDEAHERSLNIDFILGYLKTLLPRRPDLKVVITSATIDPQRFADHFATPEHAVPVIEVEGRTYPVEIRYRPLSVDLNDDQIDLTETEAICAAVDELGAGILGDILVFLATEREIRDTAKALEKHCRPGTEILPLFARLSAADQHRVFAPHSGRRIVLATNVAETSLTVPGIRFVVDAGTARISRFSTRTKVQRLPIEPISQASARQRAGRCGRVADGVCVRLYSEDDFDARPEFTDPEILRTNLAAVILQMISLGLGDVAAFPFVQPPDARAVRDGVALLDELGALEPGTGPDRRLTEVGRQLADLPIDPRLGRMLIAGRDDGALAETLVIVSALSLPDVRERPLEQQGAADAAHARFTVPGSDFLATVKLWNHLEERRAELSASAFRRTCQKEFLHWLRIREWRDLHRQLRSTTDRLGWTPNEQPAAPDAVHRAMLTGLLGHIGFRDGDKREFQGARGAKFAVFPGSSLAKNPPRYVMAAELVETSRLWARTCAAFDPAWVEAIAGDLVKRQYSEPHWSSKRESAVAYERVTLYGVPIVDRRLVPFGRVDPEAAREIFIRHALVEGDWRSRHAFFHRNAELLADAEETEARARRRDLTIDPEDLFAFYDARVGETCVSARHFDTWWKKAQRSDPHLLDVDPATLRTDAVDPGAFPDVWAQGGREFALTYVFDPTDPRDGVTVHIPLQALPTVRGAGFDWLVPGLRAELAATLIKTLPKPLRRLVVPAPDFAAAALSRLTARSEPLVLGLARELTAMTATTIDPGDFSPAALPAHLRMGFAVEGERAGTHKQSSSRGGSPHGGSSQRGASHGELGFSRNLGELQRRFAADASSALRADADVTRPPATTWTAATLGDVPRSTTIVVDGQRTTAYPTLAPGARGVGVTVAATPTDQARSMRAGVVALLHLALPGLGRGAVAAMTPAERVALAASPYRSPQTWLTDCTTAAITELAAAHDIPWGPDAFAALAADLRPRVTPLATELMLLSAEIIAGAGEVRGLIDDARGPFPEVAEDVADQLGELVYDGFVGTTAPSHLRHVPRYLAAAAERLRSLPASRDRDRQHRATIDRVLARWAAVVDSAPPALAPSINEQAHWLVEELRVSLFAQRLGTPFPVSEKRIVREIGRLAGR